MSEFQVDQALRKELIAACDMLEGLLYEMEQEDLESMRRQREENKRKGLCNWHIPPLDVDLAGYY